MKICDNFRLLNCVNGNLSVPFVDAEIVKQECRLYDLRNFCETEIQGSPQDPKSGLYLAKYLLNVHPKA
jgi:hypothetical protein